MRVNSVGQSQNANQIGDLISSEGRVKALEEDDAIGSTKVVNSKLKTNAWTAEESQDPKSLNEDQSHRNFSKQRYDPAHIQQQQQQQQQQMKTTNTQSNLSKDIILQQIKIDGQQQHQRPVTRENQRAQMHQQQVNLSEEGAQMNASAQ